MSTTSDRHVRFWDFPRHFALIEDEVMAEVLATLRAGDLVMREQMREFERTFARYIGTAECVGVSNCTDGLRLTLEALGIGAGDEVITVAHTFVATAAAIHHVGATPVLADIGPDHLMSMDSVEQLVTEQTRAVIPVHLNGRVCDMDRLGSIAAANDLIVLEDAAQAIGAKFDDRVAGTFGAAACYSFYPAKLLGAFGDAGAVVTGDPGLAEKLRHLRDHGRATKVDLSGWGWNCRLDNIQAAILYVKMTHLPEWIERRREIATSYGKGLSDIPQIRNPPLPGQENGRYDVFQNYVIEAEGRDELCQALAQRDIETMISWPTPMHRQEPLGLSHFELPMTERLCTRVLSLPMYPELTDGQVDWVIESVRAHYA